MDDMQPTLSISSSGTKRWRLNGQYHREDGPAIEFADGDKFWWLNGERHRTDGPAIEFADGGVSWWLHDKRITLNEWLDQNHILTDGEKVMFKLEYG
jgi:hypothetical protein